MRTFISISITLFCTVILLTGCTKQSKPGAKVVPQEDVKAKALLQGIWLNEEEDDVVFKVHGDTIFYPDSTSIPVYFKIVQDSLLLQSSTTVKYSIVRQTVHLFEFRNQYGDIVRLVKSDDPEHEYEFSRTRPVVLNQKRLIKRDTVVSHGQERYHSYVQVNPTTYKIIKNSYTDEGVEVGNIYYDNIVHVSVFKGAARLFSRDFRKADFKSFIPQQFYSQCILSDIVLDHIGAQGLAYRAYLPIPDSTTSYMIRIHVSFKGEYDLSI